MLQTRQENNTLYATIAISLVIAATLLYPGLAQNLLTATGFIPHGHCYLWKPELVWLHVTTDTIIGVCYVAISATLAFLVYRTRKEIPFHWMFLVFGAFIIACGATHFMEVITLWHPVYWLSGDVKLVTALASVSAALTLPPLVPKVEELLQTVKLAEGRRKQLELAKQNDEDQTWLKSNVVELSRILQGQRNLETAASLILTRLCSLIEAQQGVFYWLDRETKMPILRLAGSYASQDSPQLKPCLQLGEGLIGQCAIDQKQFLLNDVPDDYLRIGSGLGSTTPRQLIVLPVLFETQVVAVIELAALQPFTTLSLRFLNEACDTLGVVLTTIAATARTTELLLQSQALTEELQQQQAELQETNCRLEEQADELQESEAQLREQQEELQQTNEQLQHLNMELEEKANELEARNREVERKNRQIEQARQALEEKAAQLALSSRYKSEFLANMSHELRTPLNSLLILANLLGQNRDGNLTPKQIEYSQTIYAAGNDLLDLINDILDLAKIESGKLSIELQKVPLAELKTPLEQTFSQVAQQKGLEFAIVLDPQLPQVFTTDPKRLQQILRNLLSNAFKFTLQGSVTLSISRANLCLANPDSGSSDFANLHPDNSALDAAFLGQGDREQRNRNLPVIAFTVQDTGIGIPTEKQAAIFEAFQQADGTTSRKYGGTGLGLSISRELANLLGGYLTVESQEGQGSTFTVYLPDYSAAVSQRDSALFPIDSSSSSQNISQNIPQNISQKNIPLRSPDGSAEVLLNSSTDSLSSSFTGSSLGQAVNPSANPSINPSGNQQLVNSPSVQSGLTPGSPAIDSHPGVIQDYSCYAADANIKDDRDRVQPGDMVLLIIEDDLNFAHGLLEIAHQQGFKSLIATRSDVGLGMVRQFKPAAIMLDIRLTDGLGWRVLEQLRNSAQTRGIPVYVISADDHLERSLQLGAIAFLQKPITVETLDETFSALKEFVARQVKQLLIIEDDLMQSQSICELLGQNNLQTTIAASGTQAIEILQSTRFDCAILDLNLPDMDGFDLLEQIKNQDSTLPIVVYTGKELTVEEEICLKRFTETIIIKDVRSPERLFDEIMLFLHQVQTELAPSLPQGTASAASSVTASAASSNKRTEAEGSRIQASDAVLAGKKVLIIDDDVRNIFAITSLLEEYDIEVLYAENGQAGLRVLSQHPDVNLVLMDVMMPEMDGYETTCTIRSQSQFRSLPIITLTAKAMKGDREKCLEAGASDYITKPVNPDQLVSLLRVWLYG